MIGMMMRAAGCGCIVAGTSFYGFFLSHRYGEQVKELETLRHMIFLLKGQILYANAPLHEAFAAIGQRTEGALSQLFNKVAEQIEQQRGDDFLSIWKKEIDAIAADTLLAREDRKNLENLGNHLGFLDLEMQERNLLLYLEQLDLRIQDLREHRQERCRLYSGLGVMSGLFLAVMLI